MGDKGMFVLGRVWLWLETLRMLCLMKRRRSRKVRMCAGMLQGQQGQGKHASLLTTWRVCLGHRLG